MALKGDRYEESQRVEWFMNEVAERGAVAVLSTAGSGSALDQGQALVTYTVASGYYPVGVLLNDMVNNDQTRQHINWLKNEVQKGGKVTLLRRGWITTNMTSGSMTAVAGKPAYVGNAGRFCHFASGYDNTNGTAALGPLVRVGQFLSNADEDGFVKVDINLL